MENTHPFLRDGTATTSTEIRCRTLDGLRRTSCYLPELLVKIMVKLRQKPNNNDAVSIPGYVMKKNIKRRARHGPSERQRIYKKVRDMLDKAGQKKHGQH